MGRYYEPLKIIKAKGLVRLALHEFVRLPKDEWTLSRGQFTEFESELDPEVLRQIVNESGENLSDEELLGFVVYIEGRLGRSHFDSLKELSDRPEKDDRLPGR